MGQSNNNSKKRRLAGLLLGSGFVLLLMCQVSSLGILASIRRSTVAIQHENNLTRNANTSLPLPMVRRGSVTEFKLDPKHLVPHPYHDNALVLHDVSVDKYLQATNDATLTKRYLWWVVGIVAKTIETGIAIWSLVDDCEDWSQGEGGAKTGFKCVYGAVSTLISIAGAGWGAYQHGAGIWKSLVDHFPLIPSIDEAQTMMLEGLFNYSALVSNHTSIRVTPVFDLSGTLILNPRTNSTPLLLGHNFDGTPTHFSFDAWGEEDYRLHLHSVPVRNKPPGLGKRENFNAQDFTKGGLEAGLMYVEEFRHDVLTPANDFGQMDHEVSCYLGDARYNTYQFQIFDNNSEQTLAAGNIRACSDGPFDQASLFRLNSLPTPLRQECEVA